MSTSAAAPTIPLNQWSHLAAVFNDAANTYTLYLNGTAVPTQSETTAPVPNTQALVFGQIGVHQLRLRALAGPDRRHPHLQPAADRRRGAGGHEQRNLGGRQSPGLKTMSQAATTSSATITQ